MKKQLLYLSLIVCLLLSFVACGTQDAVSSTVAQTQATQSTAATEPAEDIESAVKVPAEEPVSAEDETASTERVGYDLPLFEEPESFTYWSICQGMDESKGSYLYWQQLAEKTGISIEFVDASEENAIEKYNLMMATGDLTDVIEEKGLTLGTASTCPYTGGICPSHRG